MNNLITSNLSEIKALMQNHGVIKAYLFGSAAINDMSDTSDVDFMVTFKPDLSYTDYGNNYFQLIYALQKLIDKQVDIVAEETITNPLFTSNYKQSKNSCFMSVEEKKLLTDILHPSMTILKRAETSMNI